MLQPCSFPKLMLAVLLVFTAVLSSGKVSLCLLVSHSCLLAPQLVPTIQFVLWAPRPCGCGGNLGVLLPASLPAAASPWQAEGGCLPPPIQPGAVCRDWVLPHREGLQDPSRSNRKQQQQWEGTPLAWYWRLRCMDNQHHHSSHHGSSMCIFPSIMFDVFAHLLEWDDIWYRPVIYSVEMFVSITHALSFTYDLATECVLPAVPVSSACGMKGQKE